MAYNVYGIIDIDETNNLYTFGSHQYALYFWLKCIEKGILRKYASLIHIDYHSDFSEPSETIDKKINSSSVKDLIRKNQIRNDDFIKTFLSLDIIENIKFCCKPEFDDKDKLRPFRNYETPIVLLKDMRQCH